MSCLVMREKGFSKPVKGLGLRFWNCHVRKSNCSVEPRGKALTSELSVAVTPAGPGSRPKREGGLGCSFMFIYSFKYNV